MIHPSTIFFFEEKDSLEDLCRDFLEKIKEDVWVKMDHPIKEFFKKTEKEIQENAEAFIKQYEIILPKLNIQNMERRVHPTKEGFTLEAKTPFTKTKSLTNVIFLCQPLSNLKKVRGVEFDPDFQTDFSGINAPKYVQIKISLRENNTDKFQIAFDTRMEQIKKILEESESIVEDYNSLIKKTFISEFNRRKEKIMQSAEFSRTIKVTKDLEQKENNVEKTPPQKINIEPESQKENWFFRILKRK